MAGEKEGEVIDLVWPEGNDDGELFIRGHIPDEQARETILHNSEELDNLAADTVSDEELFDSELMDDRCHHLVLGARVEHGYARWSREALADEENLNGVLRYYAAPGPGGRFPVTRVTLWPRPVCHLSVNLETGVYRCTKCDRRFLGPTKPHILRGPPDCPRLIGDEIGPFTEVYEEL